MPIPKKKEEEVKPPPPKKKTEPIKIDKQDELKAASAQQKVRPPIKQQLPVQNKSPMKRIIYN